MRPSDIAIKYIGETEIPGNQGFSDPTFEAKMNSVGFIKSQAWCSYFAELVFKEAYPEKMAELSERFSGSAVKTFDNFKDAGYLIGSVPQVDSLVIWRRYVKGKAQWQGHAGIVVSIKSTWEFDSVEGNTNDEKSREGYTVARQHRKVIFEVKDGLKVMGFVHIPKTVTITI